MSPSNPEGLNSIQHEIADGVRLRGKAPLPFDALDVLKDEYGITADRLMLTSAARVFNRPKDTSESNSRLMNQYATLISVHSGALGDFDLSGSITKTTNTASNSEATNSYSLVPLQVNAGLSKGPSIIRSGGASVRLDSPSGVMLKKNGREFRYCSFLYDENTDSVRIQQLQGVGGSEPSPELRWTSVLVDVVEHTAGALGIPRVSITSAANNDYIRNSKIPMWRAKTMYDKTAQRAGYTRMSRGDWLKSI